MPPGAAWGVFGVEDEEGQTGAPQVIAQREARLPAADHRDIHMLRRVFHGAYAFFPPSMAAAASTLASAFALTAASRRSL
jgi:hypothetical protein